MEPRLRKRASFGQVRLWRIDGGAASHRAQPPQRERGRNHTGLGPSKRTRGELLKPRDTFGDFPPGSAFPSQGMTSTSRVSPGFTGVGSINEPPSTPVSNIGWLRPLCLVRESAPLDAGQASSKSSTPALFCALLADFDQNFLPPCAEYTPGLSGSSGRKNLFRKKLGLFSTDVPPTADQVGTALPLVTPRTCTKGRSDKA